MLDWFRSRPKPPLDTWHKAWTETRMLWLADQLGGDRMLKAKVLRPIPEDFPRVDSRTDEGARRLMESLCEVMGVDHQKVELEIVEDQQIPGAAGHHDALESGRTVIRIARSRLAEFQGLVATLAHELAHELLLGRGLLTTEVDDHELVADLLPVFLGLGIFPANAALFEQARQHGSRQIRQHGYLPSHVLGYALALFAHVRGEGVPEWCEYLRLDAAEALRAGLKYLEKTGDTLFDRASLRSRSHALTPRELVERLTERQRLREAGGPLADQEGWSDRRGASGRGPVPPGGEGRVPADRGRVGRRRPCPGPRPVARLAVRRPPKPRRGDACHGRLGAGQVPRARRGGHPTAPPDARGSRRRGRRERGRALGLFGHRAEEATAPMLEALTRALIDCKTSVEEAIALSLNRVTPDMHARLNDYLAELDPELLPLAREAFGLPVAPDLEPDADEDPLWDEEIDR